MRVYLYGTQDSYAYLHGIGNATDRCLPDPPRSLAGDWLPPGCELVGRDHLRSFLPKPDFPALVAGAAILSARAAARLSPLLNRCGELLPIRLSNDPEAFYFFNITRVINAVDMGRSRFLSLPSGAIGPYEKLVFDPGQIPTDTFFFKTTQIGPITEIFATQAAVDAVKKARLTGHEFRLVWTNE